MIEPSAAFENIAEISVDHKMKTAIKWEVLMFPQKVLWS